MKIGQFLLVIILSAAVAWGFITWKTGAQRNEAASTMATKESAYERVMRTGTLRCGYILYPKAIERDLNTGALSGMVYDVMEEVGKQLSLKIEWTEEAGFASIFDGLKTSRYDVVCFTFSQTPGRARVTEFTAPIIFYPYFLYARADDNRFDNAYEKINDPAVKVAILEGELSQTVKAEDFPKALAVYMTSLADINQVLLQVSMGKADIAMTEPSSSEEFLLKNPGKLKRVPGPSLRMQATGVDVAVGEEALKSLLDTTIRALHATGFIERVVNKYTTSPDQFYYPAKPWGESSKPLQGAK